MRELEPKLGFQPIFQSHACKTINGQAQQDSTGVVLLNLSEFSPFRVPLPTRLRLRNSDY